MFHVKLLVSPRHRQNAQAPARLHRNGLRQLQRPRHRLRPHRKALASNFLDPAHARSHHPLLPPRRQPARPQPPPERQRQPRPPHPPRSTHGPRRPRNPRPHQHRPLPRKNPHQPKSPPPTHHQIHLPQAASSPSGSVGFSLRPRNHTENRQAWLLRDCVLRFRALP